jgi:hypothetical protein
MQSITSQDRADWQARCFGEVRRLIHTQTGVQPLPMRRDPWAAFRDVSLHEFAAAGVTVLAIVVAILR